MNFPIVWLLVSLFFHSKALANFTERFRWTDFRFVLNGSEIGPHTEGKGVNGTLRTRIYGFAIWLDKLFLILDPHIYENQTVPVLNYINLNATTSNPVLTPVLQNNPHYIGSANHIDIDACDRLWLLDYAKSKLIIVNITENQIIKEKQLDANDAKNLIVDVDKKDCEDAYAYLPSITEFALRIYSLKNDTLWSVHKNQSSAEGIVTVLCNRTQTHRSLYLRDLSAGKFYSVPTDLLQRTDTNKSHLFQLLGNVRNNSATDIIHFDEQNGILFFFSATVNDFGIGCWNSRRFPDEFSGNTTVGMLPQSRSMLPGIPADIKVDGCNNLWIILTHYGKEFPWPWTRASVTYAAYSISVKELVNGTVCDWEDSK